MFFNSLSGSASLILISIYILISLVMLDLFYLDYTIDSIYKAGSALSIFKCGSNNNHNDVNLNNNNALVPNTTDNPNK